MQYNNFWANLIDAYQALPDLGKILWVLLPPSVMLAGIALLLARFERARAPRADAKIRVHVTENGTQIADRPSHITNAQGTAQAFKVLGTRQSPARQRAL